MCRHDRWGISWSLAGRIIRLETVLFLLFIFIILGIAVYKFGQYPSSQAPYAYYLVGLTTLSVATYGIQDSSDVCKIGLNRALEILVASLSSLVVTSIIWPRYAREEFFERGSKALETAADSLFHLMAGIPLANWNGSRKNRKRQEESQYISRINIELEAASMAIAQEFPDFGSL